MKWGWLSVALVLVNGYRLLAQEVLFQGTSTPAPFDIRRTRPSPVARNDYALFIANSNYKDPRYQPLPNCAFDADELEKVLKTKFSFRTRVRKDLSYKDFKETLTQYDTVTWNDNDQLLIYIAGHGGFDSSIQEGFLVMRDANKVEQSQCFSLSTLQKIISRIACKHILLVLDVCYGGTIDDLIAMEGEVLRGNPIDDPPSGITKRGHPEYILRKLKPKTRIYVASGGKEPVREGRRGEHSPFAKALLAALNKTASDQSNVLTVLELTPLLEKDVPTIRMGTLDGNQSNSDFLFISK